MAQQRSIFVEGAEANGVKKEVATSIFNLIELFAGYGFNKSHSAAYALLSYQTAWLKTHYPAAFMAAVFSSDMDNTDKSVVLSEELNNMGVLLLPPSVNESAYKFTVADKATIRFGLGAIKGVGEGAIENIVLERQANGKYLDLFDFCRRIDLRKVNKRVFEALIRSGAADDLGPERSVLFASVTRATQVAEQLKQNISRGQDDMFGLDVKASHGDGNASEHDKTSFVNVPKWDDHQRLQGEKDTLGFYFRGHPIMRYEPELEKFGYRKLVDVRPGSVTVAGYIESIRMRPGSRGKRAEIILDDRTARMQLTLFPEVNQRYLDILVKDTLIIVRGEAKEDDYKGFGYVIEGKEVLTLAQLRQHYASLKLQVDEAMVKNGVISELQALLGDYRGGSNRVFVDYTGNEARVALSFGENWHIRINDKLLGELNVLLGKGKVELDYTVGNS